MELLEAVGLPDPALRLHAYPHQLSGGQRQRVMIAIALACDPELLIADEPTTALDVTTQAQIIELVRALQRDFGTAVVWISHDLGVIGQVADEVTVLRDGAVVEQAPILDVFDRPRDPYTRELLAARPVLDVAGPAPAADAEPLLTVEGLTCGSRCPAPSAARRCTRSRTCLSASAARTTLGLVGESGSGKSTVAAALTGLVQPDSGRVTLGDADVLGVQETRCQGAAPAHRPGVPGPVLVAEPACAGELLDRRAAAGAQPGRRQTRASRPGGRAAGARRAAGRRSPSDIRTSCPAGNGSGSASPGRWRPNRTCSSSTRPPPRWMCRCRRGCSSCSPGCRPSSA